MSLLAPTMALQAHPSAGPSHSSIHGPHTSTSARARATSRASASARDTLGYRSGNRYRAGQRGTLVAGGCTSSFLEGMLPRSFGRGAWSSPGRQSVRARAFPGFNSSPLSPTLAADIDRLDADMDKWNADMDRLDADLDRWSADLESSSIDRAKLIADMERLSADMETLSADVDKVDADVEYLLDDMASLQSHVSLPQVIGQTPPTPPSHSSDQLQVALSTPSPTQSSTAWLPGEAGIAVPDVALPDPSYSSMGSFLPVQRSLPSDSMLTSSGYFLPVGIPSPPAQEATPGGSSLLWPLQFGDLQPLRGSEAAGRLLPVGGPGWASPGATPPNEGLAPSTLVVDHNAGPLSGGLTLGQVGTAQGGGSQGSLLASAEVDHNTGPLLGFGGLQPFTDSEIAGLIFGAFIIACAAAAPSLDKFFAQAQRRDLGLCDSCGGVEWVPCPKCKGPADVSKVEQSQVCQLCGGKGRVLCPLCQGKVAK